MLFVAATFTFMATCAESIPIDRNSSTGYQREPSWVPNPTRRGTWDLLISCLDTLTLCIWTTPHLNIKPVLDTEENSPIKTASKVWKLPRKLKWVIIGLITPEVVMTCAATQWWQARKLRWKMREYVNRTHTQSPAVPDNNGENSEKTNRPSCPSKSSFSTNWAILRSNRFTPKECGGLTQELAFYAVMGGYSIKAPSAWRKVGENTLTPESFLDLLQAGILSTAVLNADDIHDRSKTDLIGKILICIQAGWLVLQCVARKI
ncbi:hypothetical protein RUND412_004341 [Rhizina undulata]